MCYAGRQDPEGHQHAAGPVAGRSSDDQWGTRPSPIKGGGHSTPSSSYLDAPRVSLPVVFSYKSILTSASRSLQVLKTLPLISLFFAKKCSSPHSSCSPSSSSRPPKRRRTSRPCSSSRGTTTASASPPRPTQTARPSPSRRAPAPTRRSGRSRAARSSSSARPSASTSRTARTPMARSSRSGTAAPMEM